VIDKSLTLSAAQGLFETAGDYVDVVKLGWGTSYVTYGLGKLDEYKRWLSDNGFTHVEISDGTIELPRERKLELIADFARDFTVLSEVGSKDSEVVFAPYEWVNWIKEELAAGSWKVITEGREGGTAGIFRPSGEMRTGLVEEITHEVAVDDLIFEAPAKSAQAWFIKHYGPEVNLGNIAPEEVIPLETLRLGLRGDTLREILLKGAPPE
jgi:phosphosulfolactate synthase